MRTGLIDPTGDQADPGGALVFQNGTGAANGAASEVGALTGLAVSASAFDENEKWKHFDSSRLLPGGAGAGGLSGGSAVVSPAFVGTASTELEDIEIASKAATAMSKMAPTRDLMVQALRRSPMFSTSTTMLGFTNARTVGLNMTEALRPTASLSMNAAAEIPCVWP